MKRTLSGAACALILSGCATTPQYGGEPVPLGQLVRQIKSDIATYNADSENNAAPLVDACNGQVSFTLKSVKVTVVTSAKKSTDGSLGATVEPNPAVKLNASAGASQLYSNSQTLTFVLVPVPAAAPPPVTTPPNLPPSQLVDVMRGLRNSLLSASDTTPCLTFPPDKDQDNSVEFGFTATQGTKGGATVNLFIFALGATRTTERTATNTIKISFIGHGQAFTDQ